MYLVSVFDLDFKRWDVPKHVSIVSEIIGNLDAMMACLTDIPEGDAQHKRSMMMGQTLQWLNVLQLHILCPNQHLWYDQDANWKAQPPLLDIIWGWEKFAALSFFSYCMVMAWIPMPGLPIYTHRQFCSVRLAPWPALATSSLVSEFGCRSGNWRICSV